MGAGCRAEESCPLIRTHCAVPGHNLAVPGHTVLFQDPTWLSACHTQMFTQIQTEPHERSAQWTRWQAPRPAGMRFHLEDLSSSRFSARAPSEQSRSMKSRVANMQSRRFRSRQVRCHAVMQSHPMQLSSTGSDPRSVWTRCDVSSLAL